MILAKIFQVWGCPVALNLLVAFVFAYFEKQGSWEHVRVEKEIEEKSLENESIFIKLVLPVRNIFLENEKNLMPVLNFIGSIVPVVIVIIDRLSLVMVDTAKLSVLYTNVCTSVLDLTKWNNLIVKNLLFPAFVFHLLAVLSSAKVELWFFLFCQGPSFSFVGDSFGYFVNTDSFWVNFYRHSFDFAWRGDQINFVFEN